MSITFHVSRFTLPAALPAIREFMRSDAVAEAELAFLHQPFRTVLPRLEELRGEVRARGLWAPQLPLAFGGLGLALPEFAHVAEELGRSPVGHYLFNCQAPDSGNMDLLLAHGTPAQQERWLRPLAAGTIRSCFAMTEPDFPGSNPTWMATTAAADAADYVIDGRKWFTSAADGAAFVIVMAVTDPDAPRHHRASLILVPADSPGFIRERNLPVMGAPGEDYASHAAVRFTACRVPQSYRIGAAGAGFALAQERLGPGRIHHCMRWIGICERAFDLLCRRAATRALAPDRPLGTRQTVQTWIAESRAAIDAARLLVLDAAAQLDAAGPAGARREIAQIKFFVAGVLQEVLDRAIQAHGALGLTDDLPLAYWYRHERGARIYDGPDEVHKAFVARQILREYGLDLGSGGD